MNKDEKRLDDRCELESALADYYKSCREADYPFGDDLKDLVHDATGGEVEIEIEEDRG
jgi:hypothetical protein